MNKLLAFKNYLTTRSNIEWSIMFISFAMIWMISGYFYQPEIQTKEVVKDDITVRVINQNSIPYQEEILIKGFAEADKKVELKSETSGKVTALPIQQGSFVKKGDVICSLFVAEKESFFKKAELEFKSAEKLFDEGLYSSNQLQNIKSNFERAKLELDKIRYFAKYICLKSFSLIESISRTAINFSFSKTGITISDLVSESHAM